MNRLLNLTKIFVANGIELNERRVNIFINNYDEIKYGLFENDKVFTHEETLDKMLEKKIINEEIYDILINEVNI